MNRNLKGLLAVLILAGVMATIWLTLGRKLVEDKPQATFTALDQLENEGIPLFSLPRLDGSSFSISEVKGKILILNFWATWCAPCVEEFPSMVKLAGIMRDELVLVTVSGDERKQDVEDFIKVFEGRGPNIIHLWDPKLEVAKQFGTLKLPETYIVGPDLKLRKKVVNTQDWASELIVRYLKQIQ